MGDFLNKIISITLVFLLLVVAPLVITYASNDMVAKRLVLNEMTQFIDLVTDKASVSDSDIDSLYVGVNASGGVYNVEVKRYVRLATVGEDGSIENTYMADELVGTLNVGDVVKVSVSEVGVSTTKRLLWTILKLDNGNFEPSLAGTVR